MKIISLNVNGLRAAHRKGFYDWMSGQAADVVCLQEIRAHTTQLSEELLQPPGYHTSFNTAVRKGYSGVAIYTREKPERIQHTLGWPSADQEGRFIQADFAKLSVASLYLPSGSSSAGRQEVKFDFLRRLLPTLRRMRHQRRHYILCGDWNIAHREIDLKNWRSNQNNSGFLPEERAWLDTVFDSLGLVDAYRSLYPTREQYTWWSNRGRAWENNTGWRIDYQIISPALRDTLRCASVYREQRFSDHAPLIVEYNRRVDGP